MAARSGGKKAVAFVVPLAGVGDVAHQVYETQKDACREKLDYDAFVACLAMEACPRHRAIARTRLRMHACASFQAGKLPIAGHTPLGVLPATAGGDAQTFVDEHRKHAKYAMFGVKAVGTGDDARQEPCVKVPSISQFQALVRGALLEKEEAVY